VYTSIHYSASTMCFTTNYLENIIFCRKRMKFIWTGHQCFQRWSFDPFYVVEVSLHKPVNKNGDGEHLKWQIYCPTQMVIGSQIIEHRREKTYLRHLPESTCHNPLELLLGRSHPLRQWCGSAAISDHSKNNKPSWTVAKAWRILRRCWRQWASVLSEMCSKYAWLWPSQPRYSTPSPLVNVRSVANLMKIAQPS